MRSDADRIGHHVQIAGQPVGEGLRERFKAAAPRLLVPRRFQVQLEQPGPAVWPFEATARRLVEVGKLGLDFLAREALVCELRYCVRLGNVGEEPSQGQQRPPAMDAAMPIETAEENRMEHPRRARVHIALKHVIELVRIFLRHMAERDCGHPRRELGIELCHKWNPAT